ncbi:MAG: alpha-L-rhamnosidase, partial [Armatimonadetes bacterium]|nr:alpha-L-rhamnosidase [Armatimonadota bacterium]
VELHGGARFDVPLNSSGQPVRVRVRFGESASEAMGEPNNDHTIHDFDMKLAWMGRQEVGSTGFRFVRLDLLDEDEKVQLRQIEAVMLYRPIERIGAFECSDDRLNAIWDTGAYTVHLCMQDHLWDGIKRDRLVWIGDMHPETCVVATVFGQCDVVPLSLDYVRDRTPLPNWMNGISSYSLWWILCHHEWWRRHADGDYLVEQREYLADLLRIVCERVGPDGCERLDGHRFLEWPTARDQTAIDAGLQALVVMALRAGADLSAVLGDHAAASIARETAQRASTFGREPTYSKQANALTVLAQMADPVTVNERILAMDPYRGISTFYGYYVLEARARAGDIVGCLDLIRNYWGGMLDMGATTFWEHFELDWTPDAVPIDQLPEPGRPDIHADFGDHCFVGLRHSLCHGWAAGPTAWLSEHVLGISPATPGFGSVRVEPHLGDLQWARGSVPTPLGAIHVEHRLADDGSLETELDLPSGMELAQ